VISASGGVLINSWAIADKTQTDSAGKLTPLRAQSDGKESGRWWWN
jgi:hypothetical protein